MPIYENVPNSATLTGNYPQRSGGTTTTSAKLPFFNVLDYGAVGDGTTDDSAAIQAAIDASHVHALFSGLGGTVFIPCGKYYVATGLTATNSGTTIIGEAQTGVSDELATGGTQIIVGDGQWGLTVGTSGTSDFRGYRVENLHFFEKNAGQASGGLRIFSASDGSYTRVSAGSFTAGTGILLNGVSDGVQAQYNTFTDCRVGKCLVGFEQLHANGTRWIGGYAEGSHNGQAPTTGTVGIKVTSGDTFRMIGTIIQGFDTLIDVGSGGGTCFDAEFQNVRLEVWKTVAIYVRGTVASAKFQGSGDNSIRGSIGVGSIIDAGATDTVINVPFVNVAAKRIDNGTRTRYGDRAGLERGAAVMGTVVGAVPWYDDSGNTKGYAPVYDSATGIYLVANLGGNTVNTTGVTSVTRTLTASVNAGDMVVVGGGYGLGSTQTVTITDSKSNTWTTQRHDDMNTGVTPHSFVASSVLTTPLAVGDTITATFGAAVNYPVLYCYDYAGQVAGTILDVVGGATGTGTAVSSGNITTTSDYPLLFASVYYNNSATITAGTGFTVLDTTGTTTKSESIETATGPAAGTFVGATATLSGSVDWACSVVAFKKVVGTSPPLGVTIDTTAAHIANDVTTGTPVAGAQGLAADSGHQHQLASHDHSTANKGGQLGVTAVSATGTPSATTFWRGDNTWATPSAGSLTSSTNYLGSDTTMTTNGTYYDGPTLTLAAGTWLLLGAVDMFASTSAVRTFTVKLWDGTTSISVGQHVTVGTAGADIATVPVNGIVSPGGSTTYKISATSSVNGDKILATGAGTLASYLLAVKIA